MKWKGLRDAYNRHLRLIHDFRSGSAACPPSDYLHGKEMEFLRPILCMTSTESSWEESSTQQSQQEAQANVVVENVVEDSAQDTAMPPSNSSSANTIPDEDSTIPSPTTYVHAASARASTRASRERTTVPDINRMLDILSTMAGNMRGGRTEEWSICQCLEGMMARVPPELKATMWAGVIRYIDTFIPPEQNQSFRNSEGPPPYGPYVTYTPPPAPPTQSTSYSHTASQHHWFPLYPPYIPSAPTTTSPTAPMHNHTSHSSTPQHYSQTMHVPESNDPAHSSSSYHHL